MSPLWTCSPIGMFRGSIPTRGGEPPAVLDHGRVRVFGEHADVQRVVGSLADPAEARPEPDAPHPSPGGPKVRRQPPHPVRLSPLHRDPQPTTSCRRAENQPMCPVVGPSAGGCHRIVSAVARATRSSSARVGAVPSSLAARAAERASPIAGPERPAAVRSAPLISRRDLAPPQPVVEPGGAGGAGQDQLDRHRAPAPGRRPRTAARDGRSPGPSLPPPVPRPRRGSRRPDRPPRAHGTRAQELVDPRAPVPIPRRAARPAPPGQQLQSLHRGRFPRQPPQLGGAPLRRHRPQVGRPAASPRSAAPARTRTAPRSGPRGSPGSGRRRTSPSWMTRSTPRSRSSRPS